MEGTRINGRMYGGDELVSAGIVSKMTGLSVRTIQDMASKRLIPCYRISKRAIRYRVSEIEEWVNCKKVA